ncbi:hypothetical protein B0H11DRAFT_2009360 [Mycena galericulata]|nr:hypothetical protein B0H11DRAFT_2009360 [Mycena galericulata]
MAMALPSLSLANVYRLVCVLCILQTPSAIWTLLVLGSSFPVELPLLLILYAVVTPPLMYPLLASARRTDHALSRVDQHVQRLVLLVLPWFFLICLGFVLPLLRGFDTNAVCDADDSRPYACVPLALDMVLSMATCLLLLDAMSRIVHRARDIYGTEMVPYTPPPRPVDDETKLGLGHCQAQGIPAHVRLAPAWALGTVVETETRGVQLPPDI